MVDVTGSWSINRDSILGVGPLTGTLGLYAAGPGLSISPSKCSFLAMVYRGATAWPRHVNCAKLYTTGPGPSVSLPKSSLWCIEHDGVPATVGNRFRRPTVVRAPYAAGPGPKSSIPNLNTLRSMYPGHFFMMTSRWF